MEEKDAIRAAAFVSKAWPYEEARKLVKRYPTDAGGRDRLRDGLRPERLPHSARFRKWRGLDGSPRIVGDGRLAQPPDRLSDDMDGMRKVPPGVPNRT